VWLELACTCCHSCPCISTKRHPLVSSLLLQGFIDGIGPMASLPRPLAAAGVWVLRTEQLRMVGVVSINTLSGLSSTAPAVTVVALSAALTKRPGNELH